jgi:hypothetical protein
MKYPGYLLNPGDMFQVNTERVMYATGAKKEPLSKASREKFMKIKASDKEKSSEDSKAETEKESESANNSEATQIPETKEGVSTLNNKKTLRNLLSAATEMLESEKENLTGRKKQAMRRFRRAIKHILSKRWPTDVASDAAKIHEDSLTDLYTQYTTLKARLFPPKESSVKLSSQSVEALTPIQEKLLEKALERAKENPIDHTKPYATPWRPRDYMSPFAFIPRYLEVNQNICAAVYLRHPVVRAGLAEVPSPFDFTTNQLAFNWYLRRR